jgi:hypothetical protein
MKIAEILFIIWAIAVALFWVFSMPSSAPQQAALAGQALVLVCIPYCALSVLQRSWAARQEKVQPPLELTNEAKTKS